MKKILRDLIFNIILSSFTLIFITSYSTADEVCDAFEEIISTNKNEKISDAPYLIDNEWSTQNMLGIEIYKQYEDDNYYSIYKLDHNNPEVLDKLYYTDQIYLINGKPIDDEKFDKVNQIIYETAAIQDQSYASDLKYHLLLGLDDDFYDDDFTNQFKKNANPTGDSDSLFRFLSTNKLNDKEVKITLSVYRPEEGGENKVPNLNEDLIDVDLISTESYVVPTVIAYMDMHSIQNIDSKNNIITASYILELYRHDYHNITNLLIEEFGETDEDYIYAYCQWSSIEDSNIYSDLELIWQPDINFINRIEADQNKIEKIIKIEYFYATDDYPAYTTILFTELGTAKFSTNFNLKSFPFDKQIVGIDIANHDGSGFGMPYAYGLTDVMIYPMLSSEVGGEDIYNDPREHYDDYNHVSGWSIGEKRAYWDHYLLWTKEDSKQSEETFTSIIGMTIDIERNSFYFVFKILSPIFLILLVCWSVFWTNSRELESRLTVTIVCFLALVAYTFVIDDNLPQLEYLTLMDQIILCSYIFAAFPTFITILSHNWTLKNLKDSVMIDKVSRYLGPVLYFITTYLIIVISISYNENNALKFIRSITFND